MANYLDKVSIQTPVKKFRDFDLSCQKVTTQSFMRPNIAYIKEFPKSKIRANFKTFVRMQPLYKPVLGSVQVHNRAFFVPFRVVWRPFNNLLTASPLSNANGTYVPSTVPLLPISAITDLIIANSTTVTSSDAYDFVASGAYYKLTADGRHYWKLLRQLGYPVAFNMPKTSQFSAMPLLCFAKVFLDWYYPAQYSHSGPASAIDSIMNRDTGYTLTTQDLTNLLSFSAFCYYKNDYFTAAWDSPVAPSSNVFNPE